MARLRPEDVALAHRIVLDELLPRLDERIVGADIERVLVGEEDAERVGVLPDHVPVREVALEALELVVPALDRVPFVVQDENLLGIEMRQKRTDLRRVPRRVEVPAREQDLRIRAFLVREREELLHHVDLHLQVLCTVAEAEPLAEADRVQQVTRTVPRVDE